MNNLLKKLPLPKKRKSRLIALSGIVLLLVPLVINTFLSLSVTRADSLLKFDEGYGTTTGDVNGNISGTIVNAAWKTSDLCFDSMCLYFDGTGDYVAFSDNDEWDISGSDTVTIQGWFRTGDISEGQRTIFSKYETTGADGGYKLFMNSDGKITFSIDNDNSDFPSDFATSTSSYDDNLWHHFAAVKNGGTNISLYIDAIKVASDLSITSSSLENDDTFYVGIDGDGTSNGWLGFIDEVKIYRSEARSDTDIKADYLGSNPNRGTSAEFGDTKVFLSDGLVGYWKLDEASDGSGAVTRMDSSGNNFHLTDNGTTASNSGKFGKGGNFVDDDNTYLTINDNPTLSAGSSDYTISAWVYPTSTNNRTIVSKYTTNASAMREYHLVTQASRFRWYWHVGGNQYYVDSETFGTFEANQWYFITAYKDATKNEIGISVNGGHFDKISISGGNDSDAEFRISGAGALGGNEFDGKIDEVRIYKRHLSNSEVSAIYSWAPGPTVYFPLDDNTGEPIEETITYEEGDGAYAGNSTSVSSIDTASFSGGTDLLYIAGVHSQSDSEALTVSGLGLTWTKRVDQCNPGGFRQLELWTAFGTSAGGVITLTADDSSGSELGIVAASFSGADPDNPVGGFVGENGNGQNGSCAPGTATNTTNLDVTTVNDNSVIVEVTESVARIINTADTDYTQRVAYPHLTTTNNNLYIHTRDLASSGNDTITHTLSGTAIWITAGLYINPHVSLVNAYDKSGNGNTGSVNGTFTENDWVAGKYGSAINFNGTDVNITLPDNEDLDFSTTDSFSLEAWIKHNTQSSGQDIIIAKYETTGADGGYKLLMEDDGDITCGVDTDNSDFPLDSVTSTAATYDDNVWHHVVCVKNGSGNLKLYIDGVLIANDASLTGTGTYSNDDTLYVGIDGDGTSNAWSGQLDEVKIYNYALTSKQIVESMNAGHPAPGSPIGSAVAHWKFDEGVLNTCSGGTNDFCDSSSNANDLTYSTTTGGYTNAGKFAKAFNGTGAVWASIASVPDLNFTETDDFTIGIWFKSDSASNPGATEYLLNKANTTTAGYSVYVNTSGQICLGIDDDTSWGPDRETCSTGDVYDGTWHHVTGVRDHTSTDRLYLYVDGNLEDSDSDPTSASLSNSLNLYIADRDGTDNGDEFVGDIDEIKIFRSGLDSQQVKILYNQSQSAVFASLSTDQSGSPSWSTNDAYCPPGQGSACTSPIGEWKFDDNTGTSAQDTSTNEVVGTLNNAIWAPGNFGSAVSFDGTGDYVQLGSSIKIDNSSQGSISAWIYVTGTPNRETIFSYGGGSTGNAGYFVFAVGWTGDTNSLAVAQKTNGESGGTHAIGATDLAANTWYHVAVTSDGSTYRLYVNGTEEILGVVSNNNGDWFADTTVSETDGSMLGLQYSNGAGSNLFSGKIDEFKMYDYARSPEQIAWEYYKGRAMAWWKFDECTGATAYDSSGNNFNGTIFPVSSGNTSTGDCGSGTLTEMWNDGTSGNRRGSLGFDGIDDYVQVTHNFNLIKYNVTHDFSIFSWIKRSDVDETHYIVSKEDSDNVGWRLIINSDNTVTCSMNSTDIVSVGTLNTEWHHVGCTVDRDGVGQIYIDGLPNGPSVTIPNENMITTANLRIGTRSYTSTDYFEGLLDEMQIYSYILTNDQIRNLYNEGPVSFR